MLQHRNIQLDCCRSPRIAFSPFAYFTPRGEYWELLDCESCGTPWCHAAEATGVEWFTALVGAFEPTPALKVGPALDLAALRRRYRTLRVTPHSQDWLQPSLTTPDTTEPAAQAPHALVTKAREVAIASHEACGHKRSDGTPYWTHPQRVAATLAAHGLPNEVLAAAWLHDVAEDCPTDEAVSRALLKGFEADFGPRVAWLVTEVTNYFGPEATMEQKQSRLREHARAMSDGAKWIKLADRWDNISGMVGWSAEKRRRYATSTRLLLDALEPWPKGSESLAAKIAQAAAMHLTAS
jgi:hypothetical protein